MATKQKAIEYARDASKRTGQPYVIVQKRNGQWLYGPKAYYDSPPGRVALGSKQYEEVKL